MSDNDELWARRFIAKTAFVFGLALGLVLGVILAWRTLP